MKVIVITGASAGIGRATALELASPGVALVLVARRQQRLEVLEKGVRELGGEAMSIQADLSVRPSAQRIIDLAFERYGRLDVLINNAGVGYFGTVESTTPEDVEKILALNLLAPLSSIQRALPIMKAQGRGHIINVSSIVGKRGLPLSGIYAATKFALGGISESLRVELRGTGIDVSIVYPVGTRTEFFDVVHRGDAEGEFTPKGRMQSAEEVARAIARCIHHPRVEVYPYRMARFMVWFNALFPAVVDRVLVRYVRGRVKGRQNRKDPVDDA
jgi:short-subunit dehydrogenase